MAVGRVPFSTIKTLSRLILPPQRKYSTPKIQTKNIIEVPKERLASLEATITANDPISDLGSNFPAIYFLATVNDEDVGAMTVRVYSEDSAEIFKLYIPANRRGYGYAKALVKQALSFVLTDRSTRSLLNTRKIRFHSG